MSRLAATRIAEAAKGSVCGAAGKGIVAA